MPRINKALHIVRIVKSRPGVFTFPELLAIVGANSNGYRYLTDTGVIKYTPFKIKYVHRSGYAARTIELGERGEQKLKGFNLAASMPFVGK